MEDKPLISVIIPIYNRAHLIGETIKSVINQTYDRWELIIIDDGSCDNLEKVIKNIPDKRIRYYHLDHSGIISKVRNIGLAYSYGSLIAFLDSDDLWKPHKLMYQLSLLEKHPNAAFTFSHGQQFGPGAIPPPVLETLYIGNIFHAQLIEERFVLYPTSFLFKKEVLQEVAYLDESLSGGESDFFLRIAWKYDGIFSGERLVMLRKHQQNISLEREFIFCAENIQMYEKFVRNGLLTQQQFVSVTSKQLYKLGLLYLKRKKSVEASKNFIRFIRLKTLNYKGWVRLLQSLAMSIRGQLFRI
jgi:glycosyltransferase involved in cell wall biosynthesis